MGQRIAGAVANREDFVVPTAADPAPPIPAGADIAIAGASTYITPNDDFYRIDTALLVPQLTTDSWELRIHGMVDREMTLSFDDLVARTPIERVITLTCVSNEVGGVLAGNAKWIGYPMKDLLDEVGVHPDADMLLSTSVDGFTVGTPVEIVIDGRDAILAVAMNGEPLPFEHGYPVRQVVSRSVRFRLRHQVGDGVGTHAFRQGRGLLDPARLGCAGTDQDVLAYRGAGSSGSHRAGPGAGGGNGSGRSIAGSRRSRFASTTVNGNRRHWRRSTRSTPGVNGRGCGMQARVCTRCRSERRTWTGTFRWKSALRRFPVAPRDGTPGRSP